MGYAERANPNSLRNLAPEEISEALARKAEAKRSRQANKVYRNPVNYMRAWAMAMMRKKRLEKHEAQSRICRCHFGKESE